MRQYLALIFLLFFCVSLQAGGFQLRLQGSRVLGMGLAGTALAMDASSAFYNPGALSFVQGRHIQLGTNLIIPSTAFLRAGANAIARTLNVSYTPFYGYFSWRPSKGSRWTMGFAMNNPFGSSVRWPELWEGAFISQEASISSLFFQPTISYNVSEKFGLGLGITLGSTSLFLKRALANVSAPGRSLPSVSLTGRGFGAGINVGLFYQISSQFSFAFAYRGILIQSALRGDAIFDVPNSRENDFLNTDFESHVRLPGIYTVGLGFKSEDGLRLALDVTYTNWKVYDSLNIDFKNNTLFVRDIVAERNYKNSLSINFGIEYVVSETFQLRAGTFFDGSPVQNGFVSPDLPDASMLGVTGGVGFHLSRNLRLDLGVLYEGSGERLAIYDEQNFAGIYNSNTWVMNLGINYRY